VTEARPFGRFSASDRVRKRSEFQRIQNEGQRVVSASFVFLLVRAPVGARRRLGITASRRVGNAVERNRAKRLVREAFRELRAELPSELDLVVIVRQGFGAQKLADVVAEWRATRPRIERRWAQLAPPAAPAESSGSKAPVALSVKNSC
jgi:ribonuclease P protein component